MGSLWEECIPVPCTNCTVIYMHGMNMLDLKYDLGKAVKMAISDPALTF